MPAGKLISIQNQELFGKKTKTTYQALSIKKLNTPKCALALNDQVTFR